MAIDAALRAMLEARSVALVGASPKPGTPGNQMVRQLTVGCFAGETAAVNPKYEEVEGVACYPTLEEVPFVPELVVLGVGNRLLEEQMEAAAELGARGVVVFASGLEDPPRDPPLTERLRRIAREAGMVICGGNCMGFVDVERGLRALAFEERADLEPGGVAWISHSGSAFTALLHAERGIRFNLAISSGQELTTTMADYVHYALERDSTKVISLYLETVRDPENFAAALEAARLEPGLPAVNPLDAWGTGNDAYRIFLDCSRRLAEDPDTGAFAYVVDLHSEDAEKNHAWVAEQVWNSTSKPFAVVCGISSAIQPGAARGKT